MTAKLTIDGTTRTLRGTGYHDHNWGDAPMWSVLHDWYWARAKIGPWTAIVASNIAEKKYDYDQQINFMLAKDGVILVKDHAKTTFTPADITQDEKTGKPVANRIAFDYEDGEERFHVQFDRVQTILQAARPRDGYRGGQGRRRSGPGHRTVGTVLLRQTASHGSGLNHVVLTSNPPWINFRHDDWFPDRDGAQCRRSSVSALAGETRLGDLGARFSASRHRDQRRGSVS